MFSFAVSCNFIWRRFSSPFSVGSFNRFRLVLALFFTLFFNKLELFLKLRDEYGFRCEVDDRRETLGKKIRETQLQKVPFMLILGDKDIEAGTVGVRSREDGDLGAMSLDGVLELLK